MSSPFMRGKHFVRKATCRGNHRQFHEQAQPDAP